MTDKCNHEKQWRIVEYKHNGKLDRVAVPLPADADLQQEQEAAHFVQTLEDNNQIQHEPGPLTSGRTHQIEADQGEIKRLVQRRYSAI